MSFVSGRSGGTQQGSGDPEIRSINQLMAGQIGPTLGGYGGLQGLLAPRPGAFFSAPEEALSGRLAGLAGSEDPYGDIFRKLSSFMLPASQDYFSKTVSPAILNTLTAAGFGRSGALPDSLARAGAGMTLPLMQSMMQFAPTAAEFERGSLREAMQALAAPRLNTLQEESRGPEWLLNLLRQYPRPSGAGTTTSTQHSNQTSIGISDIGKLIAAFVNPTSVAPSAAPTAVPSYGM